MNAKISLLSERSLSLDAGIEPALETIAALPGVERVVCCADLHRKRGAESPSSVAVATASLVYPKLTSVAQNCGMALLRTGLRSEDLPDGRLDELFARWRLSDAGTFDRPPVSLEDLRRIVCAGARAALDATRLEAESLENIEFGGCIGEPAVLPWREIFDVVPRFTLERSRYGFGVVPAGNHFLELQCVEEIVDADAAERWGIRTGELLVMLHADGGIISDDLGNLYARRSVTRGPAKLLYTIRKLALHMAAGPRDAAARRFYFSADPFISLDPESREGRRYMTAVRFAMNAGYASRIAAAGRLAREIDAMFPDRRTRLAVLCDFSHNSILRESVAGRFYWVHRHNAARVVPGRLVFLPGYSWTSSYICRGGDGASETLFTMDHGASKTIDAFRAAGSLRRLDDVHPTRAYDNDSDAPALVPHWSDEGVDDVVRQLAARRIAHPVARLRPLAGYRFHWKGRLARLLGRLAGGKSRI